MENFVGTWKQTTAENLENFLTASGCNDSTVQRMVTKLTAPGLLETISVSGTEVTITEGHQGSANQLTKKGVLGEMSEVTYDHGKTTKFKFTLEGGNLVETLNGDSPTTMTRAAVGDTMTMTLSCNGTQATRTFTRA